MVGASTILLLSLAILTVGCSHMDPHFWPESFKVPSQRLKSPQGNRYPSSMVAPVDREPSIGRSEWKLVNKSVYAQRTYQLVIRDRDGKIIDTDTAPDIMLDGDALLTRVEKAGKAAWNVTLEFPKEQSITQLGFSIGEYRIDRFRRLHWQLHEVDVMMSAAYANKVRLRADGNDVARVFVQLKDVRNFPIYQVQDFDLKLQVMQGKVKIEGPYSTVSGPYFKVSGTQSGPVRIEAMLDGQRVGKSIELELTTSRGRRPASSTEDECLKGLAHHLKREPIPNAPFEEEYNRLGEVLLDQFEIKITPSDLELEAGLDALSSAACTSVVVLDQAREDLSARLRQLAYKANRDAQMKGNPQGIWNRPKAQ